MLTRQHATRTSIVAADLALRELMQQQLALVVQWLRKCDLAAQIAKIGEPVAGIERKLRVDLLAQPLGERRAGTGGRDGNLEVAALQRMFFS